jgi:hypothetical protein
MKKQVCQDYDGYVCMCDPEYSDCERLKKRTLPAIQGPAPVPQYERGDL